MKSTTLQSFKICDIKISGQGLIALITAIHNSSSLREKKIERLSLVFDDEWSDVSTEEVRASLTQLINDHPDMVDIESLRDLSATEENSIKTSVIALCCGYCLFINLAGKNVGDVGAKVLAQALHHNSTLESFRLSNNHISDAGAIALAGTLHYNSILKELQLCINRISDAGAVALARALHHNSTLEKLDLSINSISDAGAVALAQALHHNSTLEWLFLCGNDGIGKEGTHKLVQALTVNTSIREWDPTLRSHGLLLPRRCEEYTTQCTQYNTVKKRISFV